MSEIIEKGVMKMMPVFPLRKTMSRTKVYDTPQLTAIPIELHRLNYDYEVISGSWWDTDGNEYYSEQEAIDSGKTIFREEDFIEEHVKLAFRYEKCYADNINIVNASRSGLSVIRILRGELAGTAFMFCKYDTIAGLNLISYGFMTHGYIDKQGFKLLKNDKQLQAELAFIIGDDVEFLKLMSYSTKGK